MIKYPFKVFQNEVDVHVFWVTKSIMLKGCIGQGDDIEEAGSELEEKEEVWLETAKETGILIPDVPAIVS